MSNSAGPKITKDGLVLDFDAANPKSYNFYADSYASNVSLHLKMDGANGSTTFTDSSPNALAVTAVGNAQISTAQSKYGGSAGYFDGTGDYLSIAANSAIDLGSGDFTIEFWVRPAAKTNAVDAVFGYGNYSCMFYHDGTNWTLEMSSTGSSNQLVITCTVTLNTWQHIAIVRNGSSIVVYKDGVSSATGTFTGTVTTNARTLRIGDNGNSQNINGYIDELKITKGVARYTSAFTSPPIPSTCTDLTRSKNVGTLTGGVDYNFSNGGSLVFDGSNDYVNIPASTNLTFGTGNFTIDLWCKTTAKTNLYPCLITSNLASQANVWSLLDRHNSYSTKFSLYVYNINSGTPFLVGTTSVSNGVWYNVVITRIGTTFSIYVNGNLEATATSSASFDGGASNAIGIGANSADTATTTYNGNITNIKIYKAKGLTSTEVYNNFVANRGRFGV
jgi:hypothetical protein